MNALAPITPATPEPVEVIVRRMPVATSSWNAETWTVEVVIATNGPTSRVRRYDERGEYTEILSLEDQNWPSRIPLLDGHARGSVANILGSVDTLRVVGGELLGRATLSRHHPLSQRIAADLSDGHQFSASIGYVTLASREQANPSTKGREKLATRIDLLEASLVVLAADRSAGTRSHSMTANPAPVEQPVTPPAPAPVVTAPPVQERAAGATTDIADRAAVNGEIRSIARLSGLDQAWVDGQIDGNATTDQARQAAFAAMQARSAPAGQVRTTTISVGTDHTDPELRVRHVGEALYARHNPAHQLSEPARPFFGLSTLDIARESLRLRGMAATGLSAATIVERALHSTSDFPLILGDSIGRTLRESYRAAPSGLKLLARKKTARDFRLQHRLQLSEGPKLLPVGEGGEFKSGSLAEAKESYKLNTWGRIITISRQAIVNDDLGAFVDLARRLGQAAAATEAQILVDLLISNTANGPTMSDSKTLFHADHGNKAASGTAISVSSLSLARTALRKQVGLSGEAIDIAPRYLLVGPDKETEAEQILTVLNPAAAADTNPFAGKLALAVDARLTGTRWYVSADPATVDGLEYAYLEGEEGVAIETKAGFEVDGVQTKARVDFGAGFVDWRGWYVNAGA
jgi:hypothetical protein